MNDIPELRTKQHAWFSNAVQTFLQNMRKKLIPSNAVVQTPIVLTQSNLQALCVTN